MRLFERLSDGFFRLNPLATGTPLAILGRREAGKTTLQKLLRGENATGRQYRPTKLPETHHKSTRRSTESTGVQHRLRVGEGLDYGGDEDNHRDWMREFERACKRGGYCLYLFRVDRLVAGDAETIDALRTDAEFLCGWREQIRQRAGARVAPVILLGTHRDLIEAANGSVKSQLDWDQTVRAHKALRGFTKAGMEKVLLGSMHEHAAAMETVDAIVRTIAYLEKQT